MNIGRTSIVVSAVLAAAAAFPAIGRADDQKPRVPRNVVVQFGQPQPQTPAPAPVGNAVTHFLDPEDVTVRKGGTVTFVVNGGGHGIAVHEVSRRTNRENIAEDLCQGPPGTDEDDRAARALLCNAAAGTANLNYDITDRRDDLVIRTGTNPPNPRVDDALHSHRLLATSGRIPGVADGSETPPASGNPAGAFLVGTLPAVAPATGFTPGNRIQVTFDKPGRYLVICMNRGHLLNDHMFGFVTVVDDNDRDGHDDGEDNSGHN
jgi:plastocyanin